MVAHKAGPHTDQQVSLVQQQIEQKLNREIEEQCQQAQLRKYNVLKRVAGNRRSTRRKEYKRGKHEAKQSTVHRQRALFSACALQERNRVAGTVNGCRYTQQCRAGGGEAMV
jgi:hypothetical protein